MKGTHSLRKPSARTSSTPHVLHVISHTHWDREWYLSFESFRLRLVRLIDRLLDLLDQDSDFRFFHLDGQSILLEDYVALRPHNCGRLVAQMKRGRILVGPWFVQGDEFLVSGEALVRNLLMGHQVARAFGSPVMRVGYVPDQFGNITQLPQILRGFGIDSAVYGRGLKGLGGKSEFWWKAPDGSRVLAICLSDWYNNAQRFPRDVDRALELCNRIINRARRHTTLRHILAMNGVDHLEAQANLSHILRAVNSRTRSFRLVHDSLPCYVRTIRRTARRLETFQGEMRQEEVSKNLSGTLSSRIHLKLANAQCQDLLEHYVEPIGVWSWLSTGEAYPAAELRYLWKTLLENHAHDSICGCHVDEVDFQMQARFRRVESLASDLVEQKLKTLSEALMAGQSKAASMVLLVNTLGYERDELVETDVDFLASDRRKEFALRDGDGRPVDYVVLSSKPVVQRILHAQRLPKLLRLQRFRILIDAPKVPQLGYLRLEVDKNTAPQMRPRSGTPLTRSLIMKNERLRVEIKPSGTLVLTDKVTGSVYPSLLEFEDTGDAGDSYTYCSPGHDTVLKTGDVAPSITQIESNRLRQSYQISHTWNLPVFLDRRTQRRSRATRTLRISTIVTLERRLPFVRLQIHVDNTVKDHRLRVLFPTGISTDHSVAEGQFALVQRPIRRKPHDTSGPIFPQIGFVDVTDGRRGFSVFTIGLPEYEVKANSSRTIAITLVRSIEWLGDIGATSSQAEQYKIPAAQRQRAYQFDLALYPHKGDTLVGEVKKYADIFASPLVAVQCPLQPETWNGARPCPPPDAVFFEEKDDFRPQYRSLDWPAAQSFFEIKAHGVALSAIKQAERNTRRTVVRLVNLTARTQAVELKSAFPMRKAYVLRLDERILAPLHVKERCRVSFRIPPHGILTLGLDLIAVGAIRSRL
jgi:alpha-mannosidase